MNECLEVLQHKARPAVDTVKFIDDYCAAYQDLFLEVRSFECFKFLHLGMLSEIKRKSLPAIAALVGLEDAQPLHHFLVNSPWNVKDIKQRRLYLLLKALKGRSFILIIDETGDKKKGKTTDYVDRQYIGNLGKIENGIVSVNAYGLLDGITFPLLFKISKPRKRLKDNDKYKTKPQLGIEIIQELVSTGFKFNIVLADSVYGESSNFVEALHEHKLEFVMAIRRNHSVLMLPDWQIQYTEWSKFERVFSNGETEVRFIREIIYGKRKTTSYWQITTNSLELPENSTWLVMTNLSGDVQASVGNVYGLRTWIEYGLKQSKNELGWADYRLTNYQGIEKWWELVFSTYLMVSLQSNIFLNQEEKTTVTSSDLIVKRFEHHREWNRPTSWKSILNNLRLIIQPYVFFCLIAPWLQVFP